MRKSKYNTAFNQTKVIRSSKGFEDMEKQMNSWFRDLFESSIRTNDSTVVNKISYFVENEQKQSEVDKKIRVTTFHIAVIDYTI